MGIVLVDAVVRESRLTNRRRDVRAWTCASALCGMRFEVKTAAPWHSQEESLKSRGTVIGLLRSPHRYFIGIMGILPRKCVNLIHHPCPEGPDQKALYPSLQPLL
jgi:hypothetical protein